ncbi:hypothetical protein [Chitinophaga deserti]|uniref:hypothetical protein n=1 Tax=Chitinophaga deserti TaxID=2164099 RepID=UPI000D6DAE53|nr:hypothetical protein [Chitinophaga deserti]
MQRICIRIQEKGPGDMMACIIPPDAVLFAKTFGCSTQFFCLRMRMKMAAPGIEPEVIWAKKILQGIMLDSAEFRVLIPHIFKNGGSCV